jgi:N-acetylglucosamine-6-sulfatase
VRKQSVLLIATLLFGVLAGLGLTVAQTQSSRAQITPSTKPNILFVLTDDMRVSDLPYMPETRKLLGGGGVKFTKAFVTRSLCCPSRATIQRGQYAHNHQVLSNRPPMGGFEKFRSQGLENSTIATWLDGAGYDTMLIGKYFNDYDNTTYVPPGWDNWYGYLGYYVQSDTYRISENGQINTYDRSQIHDTDLFADRAATFLESTAGGAPFFMYLSTNAPHTPAFAPQRHQSMFSDVSLPAPPSLNEADVSDKPAWMRNTPSLTSEELGKLRQRYRQRLRSLQSVDEMVGRLVGVLRETGELSNTYIVFTSDNGLHLGEHRINQKKWTAYEEAIHVPLLIRGPGVPRGVIRSQMALNNDLAPTFASWAGVTPPDFVDGRSLTPLLSASPPSSWRSAFLVEHWLDENGDDYAATIPDYTAVRTGRHLFARYATGETELYDLKNDPYELQSLHNTASTELKSRLASRLDALESCAAQSCRSAEN